MISTETISITCFTILCFTTSYISATIFLKDNETTTTTPDLCTITDEATIVCKGITDQFPKSASYDYPYPLICSECSFKSFTVDTFPYDNSFTALNLSSNHVIDVTGNAFFRFTSCEFIDLSNNAIETIDDHSFPRVMKNLKELYLQSNKLSSLSAEIFSTLINLKTLDLAYNQLTATTFENDFFANLTTLKVLDLGHNKIEVLKSSSFSHLKDLQELNLQGNQLTSLALGTFKEMSLLTYLNLADNSLTNLSLGTFSGLTNLLGLKLSNNKLEDFNGTELLSSFVIEDVDISKNNISSLNEHMIYANAPTLQFIHLGGNFFYCDSLVETLEFWKSKGVRFPVENGEYASSNIAGIRCQVRTSKSDATSFNFKQNLICAMYAAFISVIVLFVR